MKIGHGYDVHRFGGDKPLYLGCVKFDSGLSLLAHSDGDVVSHAICDSLLGAAGLRDIGHQFPDNDDEYENASGASLLKKTNELIREKGYVISNIDVTIVAEKPKMAKNIVNMINAVASALDTEADRINIKATTEEGLGIAGNGIACHAVCLIERS